MRTPAVVVLLAVVLACSWVPADDGEGVRGAACESAKRLIPRAMKDPSSAEFDWSSVAAEQVADGTLGMSGKKFFRVSGVVRGKNSFGAVVPSKWTAIVQSVDGSLPVELLFLDGSVVAKTEEGRDILGRLAQKKLREEAERGQAVVRGIDAFFDAEKEKAAELRRERAAMFERQRVDAIRRDGSKAGKLAAEKMGRALGRISEKEMASRGKKEAARVKVAESDVESFVGGFVDGMNAAKSSAAAR